jgi:hypothetical protein
MTKGDILLVMFDCKPMAFDRPLYLWGKLTEIVKSVGETAPQTMGDTGKASQPW